MKKLIYILFLLLTTFGYSQSGVGYVNYKSYKTHYGNGSSSTYNGVTYAGISDNITELEAVLDVNQPGTTLTHQGETLVNSSYGFIGGKPPHWYSEFYAVHHWGWFQPQETGTYRFSLASDDASALWIDGELKLFRPCCGTSYVNVNLVAGQWYRLDTKWQEYTGGDYMRLLYSPPSSTSFFNVGASSHLIFSNQEPTYPHKLDVTYNLNSSLDKPKFNSWVSYQSLGTETTPSPLSSNGVKSYDSNGNGLDEIVYSTGNIKSTTTNGSVEWCVIYNPLVTNQYRYRVGIDKREFGNVDPTKVTSLQLFDLWDGPVTFNSQDAYWANYYIYTDTALDFTNSTFSTNIREMSYGNYALQAEFSFEDITGFTPHDIHLGMDETYFTTTYPDMITIADVAKGFSQLTNQTDTPNGPQGGIFTSDVEFILGDVNKDNTFDFLDTQMLLQHIAGDTSPFTNNTVSNSMFMFDGDYTNSLTTNWSIHRPTSKHFTHNLDENNKEQTKSIDVAFLGDLNFSHSSTLQSVNISFSKSPRISFSAKSNSENSVKLNVDKVGDFVNVSIDIPQNISNIIGSQFKVYFDESRVEYQSVEYSNTNIPNFSSQRGNYINIGSFSSDELINLNGGITYTIKFKLKEQLETTLGLVSIGFSELVDKDGNTIDWRIE